MPPKRKRGDGTADAPTPPTPPAKREGAAGHASAALCRRRCPLVLELVMFSGVLDAYDLTVIARCCRETRAAVASFWEGVRRGNNPVTRLRSVERLVDDPAKNNTGFAEYVPVSQAADCVVCGALTRFRHPLEGSMLCAACGKKADDAAYDTPLFHFLMISEWNAKKFPRLSSSVDFGKHLPYAKRRAWLPDPKDTRLVNYVTYAPGFAASTKDALATHGDDAARRSAHFPPNVALERVFLTRDVICLMLEKFGGPQLLKERIRNGGLPALDPAKPDA